MKYAIGGLALLLATGAVSFAQQYEVGGLAGAGFLNGATVSGAAGSAAAGLKPGPAFGFLLGQNLYPRVSGEVRYTLRNGDLRLSSGGSEATFSGMTHAIHYDILLHPKETRGKAMPFLAAGGGMRIFRGTGRETAYQALSQFAYLTKTQEIQPLISVGGGVKLQLGEKLYLRTEVRDYITPFPNQVIAPLPGQKASGWLHDFVPMVGISYIF